MPIGFPGPLGELVELLELLPSLRGQRAWIERFQSEGVIEPSFRQGRVELQGVQRAGDGADVQGWLSPLRCGEGGYGEVVPGLWDLRLEPGRLFEELDSFLGLAFIDVERGKVKKFLRGSAALDGSFQSNAQAVPIAGSLLTEVRRPESRREAKALA